MDRSRSGRVEELTPDEMAKAVGGLQVRDLTVWATWKYTDRTPAWAVANAQAMGYEVEKID
jgi:hypothetical protein